VTAFAEGPRRTPRYSRMPARSRSSPIVSSRGAIKAYETFSKLTPMNPAKQDHDKYKVEPYVWAEYIIGPGSTYRFGEGRVHLEYRYLTLDVHRSDRMDARMPARIRRLADRPMPAAQMERVFIRRAVQGRCL